MMDNTSEPFARLVEVGVKPSKGDEDIDIDSDDGLSSESAAQEACEPPLRPRRRSTVLGPETSGCYLIFNDQQKRWTGQWSPGAVDDAVFFMRPKVKVPQFKYTKKEIIVLKSDNILMRDERKDFLQGLCLFVKLAKEFQGDFLVISKADLDDRKVVLLGLNEQHEIQHFDSEDVFYSANNLAAVAVAPTASIAFKAKTMEVPIFVGLAQQEGGFAVSFDTRQGKK
ncbi:hypothetical protein BESB_013100 [Besnoitia besnoiti]|uniref:Immune mapped protein 2 N-terminal domain-containing protein n=1 Tax=Besnoitia besnoiti TaxID=94643 RepID=A0A2A9M2H2_BESBE|nr:hypothetical protein BESB_013100 [Besnoitia besnoiti]PFH32698.1 hypothetical protein BESB_013100 [Besnoitia besnoiti]